MPTVSIALCTYNGATYLREQWQNYLNQTRLPDEIVVCDDGSTDGTRELLQQLATDAPFPVQLVFNPSPLRVARNFEQAMQHCSGDLIFLSDQDDYWVPEKIARLTAEFTARPQCDALFSDALLVDEQLQSLNQTLWQAAQIDETIQRRWQAGQAFDITLLSNRVAGCTMALRRILRDQALPLPITLPPTMLHDEWLVLLASALNSIGLVDDPLVWYRQHAAQQVGTRPVVQAGATGIRSRFNRPRAEKLAPIQAEQERLTQIATSLADRLKPTEPALKKAAAMQQYVARRSKLSTDRAGRLLPVLMMALRGDYGRYARPGSRWTGPWLTALGDLLE